MSPAKILESSYIKSSGMRSISLYLFTSFGTTGYIGEVKITAAIVEIANLPFRVKIIEITHHWKPYSSQKFGRAVTYSFIKQLSSSMVFL
jgi:S-adenosylmethionine hydrolase